MAVSISILSSSLQPWLTQSHKDMAFRSPSASSAFLAVSRTRRSYVAVNAISNCYSAPRAAPLHCFSLPRAFSSLPCAFCSLSSLSSFSGLSLELNFRNIRVRQNRGGVLMVRAGKAALCQTKRNRSRKSLARTHGFRRRMRTTSGRALLKRRRLKGRWVLCPKSYPRTGKRS